MQHAGISIVSFLETIHLCQMLKQKEGRKERREKRKGREKGKSNLVVGGAEQTDKKLAAGRV